MLAGRDPSGKYGNLPSAICAHVSVCVCMSECACTCVCVCERVCECVCLIIFTSNNEIPKLHISE